MIATPRTRFLHDPNREEWQRISHSALFERATDAALLQLLMDSGSDNDPQNSAARHHRLEGARALVYLLSTLADPKPEPKKPDNQLDHTL